MRFVSGQYARGTNKKMYQADQPVCQACPVVAARITNGSRRRSLVIGPFDTALRRQRVWMATSEARSALKMRKQLVEPVFGIIKEQQGYEGSCCLGLKMLQPNGPCWPPPSA